MQSNKLEKVPKYRYDCVYNAETLVKFNEIT